MCHDTLVSFDLRVDATGNFLLIAPSFLFPPWLLLPDRLLVLTFRSTWVHACELETSLVWESTKAAQSCLLRMQPCAGTTWHWRASVPHSTNGAARSHHPAFASRSEFKGFSWAKTSGCAMLCDRVGLKEESCTPHLWDICYLFWKLIYPPTLLKLF